MIKLSELQMKEVIDSEEGKRLGHIYDLVINPITGVIESIIILNRERKGGFFANAEEISISWQQITKIGVDVILVKRSYQPPLYLESSKRNFHY